MPDIYIFFMRYIHTQQTSLTIHHPSCFNVNVHPPVIVSVTRFPSPVGSHNYNMQCPWGMLQYLDIYVNACMCMWCIIEGTTNLPRPIL